jgi:hypothetical protein
MPSSGKDDVFVRAGRVPRVLRYDATHEFFTGDERTVHSKPTLEQKPRGQ